ncbi:ectonucleotide pyrophosphatase/phosphodiesterase family member 7-like [Diadema antillarum]|uniref:ectonucleotide pyrophosphatase/phosphodiesterase family member 7-like n=2 Tax=Diadema antillarum TaxID=105358 RepID=UPI003A83F499
MCAGKVTVIVTALVLSITLSTSEAVEGKQQKLILLLTDGLRWDSYGQDLPHLNEVARTGVKTAWMDGVFLTQSTTSMYSIATGLYPESHGVIHNVYFDPITKNRTYSFADTLNVTEWFDTGAEPIWVTAILQGKHAGTIMYPGGNVPIKGIRPDKNVPSTSWFWYNYEMKARINDTISWLTENDFDLVMLYFDNPDEWLHIYGIDHPESIKKLQEVDEAIGYLFDVIAERQLEDIINVIIASDHGHINQQQWKHVCLYDYINESDVDFIIADYGPTFQLVPNDGKLDEIYNALKTAHPALTVYKKEDIPDRLHYGKSDRVLPIFGLVDPGWHLHTRIGENDTDYAGSAHGYDNQWMIMKSSFYARGPFFRENYASSPIESVDIYPLMCEILGLDPAPNNGSRGRYVDMIASTGDATGVHSAVGRGGWLTCAFINLLVSSVVFLEYAK